MTITFEELDAIRKSSVAPTAADLPAAVQVCQKIRERLVTHPLLLRYVRHRMSGPSVLDSTPWAALGQRLAATLQVVDIEHPIEISDGGQRTGRRADAIDSASVATQLLMSQVYLWTNRVDHEWRQTTAEFPRCVVARDILQYPMMFVCNETGYSVDGGPHDKQTIDWTFLVDSGTGVAVYTFVGSRPGDPDESRQCLDGGMLPYGSTWPNDYSPSQVDAAKHWLTKLAFLNSPYVDLRKHRLTRQMRRDLERKHGKDIAADDTVSVVVLRSQKADRRPSIGNEVGPEWKHHWWVRGHYRAQWYPHQKSHKVIWVAPYIKGDTSKPLLEKVYSVCR